MHYNINEIFPIQQVKCNKHAWEDVEKKLEITFPMDYKMFIDFYGEGSINEFLWVLSPFSENENLNSIEKYKVMKDAYSSIKMNFQNSFLLIFIMGK